MKKYFIGSVLSGGGSVPSEKATPETWVNMVNEIQKASCHILFLTSFSSSLSPKFLLHQILHLFR
jgi:hypothetical protein